MNKILLSILLLAVLFSFQAVSADPVSYTIWSSDFTKDIYVQSGSPTTNYEADTEGSSGRWQMGRHPNAGILIQRTYACFNHGEVNNTLINATLELTSRAIGGPSQIHHVMNLDNVTEAMVYNNQPCNVDFSDSDNCNLTAESQNESFVSGNNYTWDITQMVNRSYHDGNTTTCFVMRGTNEAIEQNVGYYSRENTAVSDDSRPRVIIYFESDSNSPVVTVDSPTNESYEWAGTIDFDVSCTDDSACDTCYIGDTVDDSSPYNITVDLNTSFTFNVTCNDTFNKINYSLVDVNSYFINKYQDQPFFVYETNTYDLNLTLQLNDTGYNAPVTNQVNITINNTEYPATLIDSTTTSGVTNYTYEYSNFPYQLVISQSNLTLNWTYTLWATGGGTNTTQTTSNTQQTVQQAFNVSSTSHNSTVVEQSTQTIFAITNNVTANYTLTGNITFNATNYTPTWNGTNYHVNLTIPDVSTDTTINDIASWFNISYNNTYFIRNTGTTSMKIDFINITECSLIANATLNITFYDEENITLQNNDADVILYAGGVPFSFGISGQKYQAYCIDPNTATRQGNASVFYGDNGFFTQREYYALNITYNNTPKTISAYDLNASKATTITFTVIDENGLEYSNVFLQAQRWYINEDVFRTVAMCKTNNNGQCDMNLERAQYYKFNIIDNTGLNVYATEYQYLNTTSQSITVQAGTGEGYLYASGDYVFSFVQPTETNSTGIIVFNTVSGTDAELNVNATYSNKTILYNFSANTSSITLVIDFGNVSNQLITVNLYAINSEGYTTSLGTFYLDFLEDLSLGRDSVMGFFLLMCVMAFIGFQIRPSFGFVGIMFAFWLLNATRIFPFKFQVFMGGTVLLAVGIIISEALER